MITHKIPLPFRQEALLQLKAGDRVLLSGTIYAARDEAHKRLIALKHAGEELPVDLSNQVIYYVGPAPSKPGQVINSAGPTTAKRMDKHMSDMLELGVKGFIGKGERGAEARELMKGKAIYMAALGGVAAKQAQSIVAQEVIAFEDAGMEALRKLEVVDFPVIVIDDFNGQDYYELRNSL